MGSQWLVIDKINGKESPRSTPEPPLKRPKQIFRGRLRGTSRAHLAIYFVDDESGLYSGGTKSQGKCLAS